jgi:transposase-like protein
VVRRGVVRLFTDEGVSALGLQRVLGFASYETAWAWLHKLRRAMVNPERDLLDGLVEVDETYFGARGSGNEGRETGKTLIVIGVEVPSKGFGRVRLARVPDATGASLRGFVHDTVARGATVRTDEFAAYRKLAKEGYHHTPISVISSGEEAHVILPGCIAVASLLKRWITGTPHYSISDKHFDYATFHGFSSALPLRRWVTMKNWSARSAHLRRRSAP